MRKQNNQAFILNWAPETKQVECEGERLLMHTEIYLRVSVYTIYIWVQVCGWRGLVPGIEPRTWACIFKWPRYGQLRHRDSSGVVVQVWRPRNQTSCPLPAPRPANLHFRVRAVQAILTPGLEPKECMPQPYMNFVRHVTISSFCFCLFFYCCYAATVTPLAL